MYNQNNIQETVSVIIALKLLKSVGLYIKKTLTQQLRF